MTLLLDTHTLLWWLADDGRLGPETRDQVADPATTVMASVVSLWKLAIKTRVGKLRADLAAVEQAIIDADMVRLAISQAHLQVLTTLPSFHRDPFDHLLIAQAIGEGATLVSNDSAFSAYPVAVRRCSS